MRKTLIISFAIALLLLPAACCGDGGTQPQATPTPTGDEFAIPADFSRYYDPTGLYSISYPPDWDVNLLVLQEGERIAKERLQDINSDLDLEEVQLLFLAGVPQGAGLEPNMIVLVGPRDPALTSIAEVTGSEVSGILTVADSYREISREYTIIDGRGAAILEFEVNMSEQRFHNLQMYTIAGETVWTVACATSRDTGNYSQHEDELHAIIRSLQISD